MLRKLPARNMNLAIIGINNSYKMAVQITISLKQFPEPSRDSFIEMDYNE